MDPRDLELSVSVTVGAIHTWLVEVQFKGVNLMSTFYLLFHLKGPTDIRSTLMYLMTLFPRKLFNDALPQIVLKHQLYSIHNDKTVVDRELVRCLFIE